MGKINRPETSARNCHYSLPNNPEQRSSHDKASNHSLVLCVLSLAYETVDMKSLFLFGFKNISPLAKISYVTEHKQKVIYISTVTRIGKK